MIRDRMPKPMVKFENHVAAWVQPPIVGMFSGELKTSTGKIPIGVTRFPGTISAVSMSIGSGKDDAADILRVVGNVYAGVNGADAVCSTAPAIDYVSGEANSDKTTANAISGETAGITSAVINTTYATVAAGDIIYMQLGVTRTATPTNEIAQVAIMVEIDPVLP